MNETQNITVMRFKNRENGSLRFPKIILKI